MTASSPETRRPATPTLRIEGLTVAWQRNGALFDAVVDVSLDLEPGCALALVGESGSGKTTLVNAVLGLPPERAVVRSGRILLGGVDVLAADVETRRDLRGRLVGTVGQLPGTAFDPLFPMQFQFMEAILAHGQATESEAQAMIRAALDRAGLDLPEQGRHMYPHQFSGGMLQRAQVAAALLHDPVLIIADEPTSALDPVRAASLAVALRAVKEGGASLLLATHDLLLAARLADRILVMDQGRVIEQGPVRQVLDHPEHPTTRALVAANPARLGPPAFLAANMSGGLDAGD
jgi:ABC-type glutathione transport system ATPase component